MRAYKCNKLNNMNSNITITEANKLYVASLLKTYKSFVHLCERNNLSFCVAGGSLIGAVRHNGLIPWDDDIDIFMPRKDYNKFLELKTSLIDKEYEIVDFETPGYDQPFAKYCDARTTVIPFSNSKFVYGIFIDIFPLDNARGPKRLINIETFIYRNLIRLYLYLNKGKIQKCCIPQKMIRTIMRIFESNVFKGDMVCSPLGVYKEKEICPKDDFIFEKHQFEDTYTYIPKGYDKYLTQIYGNYMQLPPIEKRISHHALYYVNFYKRINPSDLHIHHNIEGGMYYEREEMKCAYKYKKDES